MADKYKLYTLFVHNKTSLTFAKMAPMRLLKLLPPDNTCVKLFAQTGLYTRQLTD